jgi:hypothetical protein
MFGSKSILRLTFLFLFCLSNVNHTSADEININSSIGSPYFISLWALDKDSLQRTEYLCNAFMIDTNFAITSSECIKDKFPIGGSYNHIERGKRGESLFIYDAWSLDIENSNTYGISILHTPLGMSPWIKEYGNPKWVAPISRLSKTNLELTYWVDSNKKILLTQSKIKMITKKNSFANKGSFKHFNGSLVKPRIKSTSIDCRNLTGSPLVENNGNGIIRVVGISLPNKCDIKNLRFAALAELQPKIDEGKKALEKSLIENRYGEPFKPILNSILPNETREFIPSELIDNSRKSFIKIGYDPESGEADVWGLEFNVHLNRYQIILGFRNEIDGCVLAKKGSIKLQISKNNSQQIHYSAIVSDIERCWENTKTYLFKEQLNSGIEQNLFCNLELQPIGTSFETTGNNIKYLSLSFNKPCLGIASKIWIRFNVKIDNEYMDSDTEPFIDGWYGPWDPYLFSIN